jgi:hypothetical protein
MAVAARPDIYPRGSLVVRTQMLKPKKGNVPLSLPTSLSLSFTHAYTHTLSFLLNISLHHFFSLCHLGNYEFLCFFITKESKQCWATKVLLIIILFTYYYVSEILLVSCLKLNLFMSKMLLDSNIFFKLAI